MIPAPSGWDALWMLWRLVRLPLAFVLAAAAALWLVLR